MRLLALAPLLLLAACGKQMWTEDEIRNLAEDEADARVTALESRVSALQEKLEAQAAQLVATGRLAASSQDYVESVQQQVIHNARVANSNAIKDMTRRGDCGQRVVQRNGNFYNENVPCQEKDLSR